MKTVLYSSFGGRFSDNPRAIYEEIERRGIDVEHIWVANTEHLKNFPKSVETVMQESEAESRAFARADPFVGNSPTNPFRYPKKPGSFYLQTWHGTALKRIYWDEVGAVREQSLVDEMMAGPKTWDALLSSNAFSTDVFPKAFGYTGPVWETGYPRNDVLCSPQRDEIRNALRTQLGINSHQQAVLYTPTWRDDLVGSDGNHSVRLQLDIERFAATLGPGYKLLLRLHYKIAANYADTDNPSVINLTDYPDIAELYLAADAMITDYSSTMFDFALTGKPLIFFAYDLSDYRDRLRGFYFDLLAEAPGPVVQTSDGVLAAISRLHTDTDTYASRYQAFQLKFCHLDDGHAAARVVDRLIEQDAL